MSAPVDSAAQSLPEHATLSESAIPGHSAAPSLLLARDSTESGSHTPGPWRVTADAGDWSASHDGLGCSCYQGIVNSDGVVVAIAVAHDDEISISPDCGDISRLIASAPDLLSIAKRWAAIDGGAWHIERHAREKAELLADTRAALAKAGAAS